MVTRGTFATMSKSTLSRSGSVHVRAHTRSGRRGPIDVAAHDRSAPQGGSAADALPAYLHPTAVAKAQQKMQDYLTFFRQNAARDKEQGVDNGWQLAIAHLEHFLDGTGTPVVLTSEQIGSMPALQKAEEAARKKFEDTFTATTLNAKLNERIRGVVEGTPLDFSDFWDTQINLASSRPGNYEALGRTTINSKGIFRATRKGDIITIAGEVTHRLGVRDLTRPGEHYRDPYDFDPGQPGSFPAITLEHAGKAKRFDMVSEPRRQHVVARVRVQKDGSLELEGLPSWGTIQ